MIERGALAADARPGRVLLAPPANQRSLEVASGPLLDAENCRRLIEQVTAWRPAEPNVAGGVEIGDLHDDADGTLAGIARRLWEMNATLWQLDVVRVHPGDPPVLFRRPPGDPARDALDMAVVPHRKVSARISLEGTLDLTVVASRVRLAPGEMAAWPAFLPWNEPAIETATIELGFWGHGPALR